MHLDTLHPTSLFSDVMSINILFFRLLTCRTSIYMTSFYDPSKKSLTHPCLVVWDRHRQATTNCPPGNSPRTSDTLHHTSTLWSSLPMEEMGYIAYITSPYPLLAAVHHAQRAREERLEQDLLSQWHGACHGLPFCQRSLVTHRSSHERGLVSCQASR